MRHASTALLLAALCPAQDPGDAIHRLHREGVLGTSMTLVVHGGDREQAEKVETRVLQEIERLDRILSRYVPDSELRRFAASQGEQEISLDLARVLRFCGLWRERSGGVFEPGVAALAALWRDAEESPPSAEQLATAVAKATAPQWTLDYEHRLATRVGDAEFDLDGLAKGYVLDVACQKTWQQFGGLVEGFVLEIGGDARIAGDAARVVAVVDPRHPADNAEPLCEVTVTGAIASSGGHARGFEVGGEHLSHILDPRTGRPVSQVLGATVVAPDAVTADALATILNVLEPAESLALVAEQKDVECLIVGADGTVHQSRGWRYRVVHTAEAGSDVQAGNPSAWPGGAELQVAFELADPSQGGKRRTGIERPYVAIWIEDAEGEPVRTLVLWVENLNWLRDLRAWSRHHARDREFVDAKTRATRRPGAYDVTWNGLDDEGRPVAPGDYTVLLEAARENGTYQLMKQAVTIGSEPFEHVLEGNEEISAATVRLVKRSGDGD